jgi:mRNA-degrading endonuclease RelE of RelBE toxin-antitoxin system
MYELEPTTQYRVKYNKLDARLKHLIHEAMEILREFPTEYQGRIMRLAKRKENVYYRIRVPGAHVHYFIHEDQPLVTLTNIEVLRR